MASDFNIVVVGASAGGIGALQALVAGLPATFNAAVFVVLHIPPDSVSHLHEILTSKGPLPARQAHDGEEIKARHIYVASPDHHLLVDGDRVSVKKGPKENRFRPSIDALFRSAAYSHRTKVIGMVLSGALDDGTSGLWSIKRLGGITIVQDPQEAVFGSMPLSALKHVEIDYRLRSDEMGPVLAGLASMEASKAVPIPEDIEHRMRVEKEVAADANAYKRGIMRYGELSEFTCPECHGVLVSITEGTIVRYRCHTGHGFTVSALLAGITAAVEPSLWQATRALEEAVMLLDQMAQNLVETGQPAAAASFSQKARETEQRARILQDVTVQHEHLSQDVLLDKTADGIEEIGCGGR